MAIERKLRTDRLDVDEYFSRMARLVALRSTCARRAVGCVIVDDQNLVLATGYNGVHRGAVHCIDVRCDGANMPSGTGLTSCQAIHAEQNALLQCHDVERILTIYCTARPCITCMRMIANTGCRRIVFTEDYPHPESEDVAAIAGIELVKMNLDDGS